MSDQGFFALEIHDASLWEPGRVLPAVERMQEWGYNVLVLHQNDLLDACTQLSHTANYGVSDLRLKKVRNNTAWLNRLVERLEGFGARLFLEIKEPSFHDYALELWPELLGSDGAPDPLKAQWADFCRQKVEDLVARVPGIGGLIVNLSSPESRVSLPDFLASHSTDGKDEAWFDRMISAFHDPLSETGKELYIRDFSYTADMQSKVLDAAMRVSPEIGASIKITAHDYFPEFPENPAIATVTGKTVLEFEGFGEHMGWGVIPNCRVEEFRQRMTGYRAASAHGFLMRISWEAITGESALDSLSAVNVYALPQLAVGDRDSTTLIVQWLTRTFELEAQMATRIAGMMTRSWQVAAASYWFGEVFPRHSCLPSTWQEGWLSMDTSGMGNRGQEITIDPADPRLSEKARLALFEQKEKAVTLARTLADEAEALAGDLSGELASRMKAFSRLPYFARQFELASKACFYAARNISDEVYRIRSLHSELLDFAEELEQMWHAEGDVPHHYRILLDPAQVRLFAASLPG